MEPSDLGTRMRQARTGAKLGYLEITDRLGWGRGRLANYERGVRVPTPDDILAWARVLDVRPGEFVDAALAAKAARRRAA